MKILFTLSVIFGFLTMAGLFGSFLALTDIYNNTEPNLDAEWRIVNISSLITMIFTVLSMVTIFLQALKVSEKQFKLQQLKKGG